MRCSRCRSQLVDYLYEDLSPSRRARVEAHLEGCADCRAALLEMRFALDAARKAPKPVPERIPTQKILAAARHLHSEPVAWWQSWWRPRALAGAVAVLFVGSVLYYQFEQREPALRRLETAAPRSTTPVYEYAPVVPVPPPAKEGLGQEAARVEPKSLESDRGDVAHFGMAEESKLKYSRFIPASPPIGAPAPAEAAPAAPPVLRSLPPPEPAKQASHFGFHASQDADLPPPAPARQAPAGPAPLLPAIGEVDQRKAPKSEAGKLGAVDALKPKDPRTMARADGDAPTAGALLKRDASSNLNAVKERESSELSVLSQQMEALAFGVQFATPDLRLADRLLETTTMARLGGVAGGRAQGVRFTTQARRMEAYGQPAAVAVPDATATSLHARAQAMLLSGQAVEAASKYLELLEQYPHYTYQDHVLIELGNALETGRRYSEALTAYRRAQATPWGRSNSALAERIRRLEESPPVAPARPSK